MSNKKLESIVLKAELCESCLSLYLSLSLSFSLYFLSHNGLKVSRNETEERDTISYS